MKTKGILAEIDAEIGKLQQVRAILAGSNGHKAKTTTKDTVKKRQLSPEARARIAAAQKTGWAKANKIAK